ncbi:unnamed protein product [Phytomonas sp. EM1]|nr:unnamed protein product [Phytomonas sp. EM1]|eukprot:CCW61872.1 unnamed protein product [Phytomonas sp. isolate EM1]
MSDRFSYLRQKLKSLRDISNISAVLLHKFFPTERCSFLCPREDPTFIGEEAMLDTLLDKRGMDVLNIEENKTKKYLGGAASTEDFSVVTLDGETPSQERIRNQNSGQLFISSDYPSRITDPKALSQLLLLGEVVEACHDVNSRADCQRPHKEINYRVGSTSRWIRQILCVCEDTKKDHLEGKLKHQQEDSETILCAIKNTNDSEGNVPQLSPTAGLSISTTVSDDKTRVSLCFPRLLSRAVTPRRTTEDSSHGVSDVSVVFRVLVEAQIVNAAYYQPCPSREVPMSNKINAQRIKDAYDSYHSTVVKYETRFLAALRELVAVLLQAYREELRGGNFSVNTNPETIHQTFSLDVPVYHVRVAVTDTIETRLSQLRSLCNALISHCVDPSSSLMWESTCALRVLHDLSAITEALVMVIGTPITAVEGEGGEKVECVDKEIMFSSTMAARMIFLKSIIRLLVELDTFMAHCTAHRPGEAHDGGFASSVANHAPREQRNISKLRIRRLSQALWTFYKDACALLFLHPTAAHLMHRVCNEALELRISALMSSPALPGPFVAICREYLHHSCSTESGSVDTRREVYGPLESTGETLSEAFLEIPKSFMDHFTTPLRHLMPPPSILVHCRQGVSRSPSVASMYFISHMKHALRNWQRGDGKANPNVVVGEGSQKEAEPSPMFIAQFIDVLREARPEINPNLSFCCELASFCRCILEN